MKKLVISLVFAPFSLMAADCLNLAQIKVNIPAIKKALNSNRGNVTIDGKVYTIDRGQEGKVIDDFLNDKFDGYQLYRVGKKDGTLLCKYVAYDHKTRVRGSFLLKSKK